MTAPGEKAGPIGPRPLYYDVTHLRHNAGRAIASGIRRIDFEFARHFFTRRPGTQAIEYRLGTPGVLGEASAIRQIVDVRSAPGPRDPAGVGPRSRGATGRLAHDALSFARFLNLPFRAGAGAVAPGAVYLNVAQHALAYRVFLKWLGGRPDVRGVFFVHDLMPLDYPEFWRAGYARLFEAGIGNLARFGAAFLVSTEAVKERLGQELRRRGRRDAPVLALPFPAFGMAGGAPATPPADLAGTSYFVMVGTLEPRKNHLLVLNVWRRLAEAGGPVPRLVIVGRRGWENEQVVDMLERCKAIRPFVEEAAAMPDAQMRALVAGARGLLFPSFDEGFGLPLAEALEAGTPVVASDVPVLREAAQGKALFLDPLDGLGWSAAVSGLAEPSSPLATRARALACAFRRGEPAAYFARVEAFLDSL